MKTKYQAALLEVEGRLRGIKRTAKPTPWKAENYVGGGVSKLVYLDLKIPLVRAAFKEGFSFSSLEPKEQWKIWNHIWQQSKIFEAMLLPSYWVASRPLAEIIENKKLLLKWLERVDNWAHSDELSALYSKMLEHEPSSMLPVFKKWNLSKEPWVKRQSMVGLMFYSRFRTRKPKVQLILESIERHIEDPHYYVQKGVGWALRECWNVYPRETLRYLQRNARRIPPAAWTAATEKLSPREKSALMKLRKAKASGS